MKKHEIIASIILIVWLGLIFYPNKHIGIVSSASVTDLAATCDHSLWEHVYKSDRLHLILDCAEAAGIVDQVEVEPDGDYHILLHVDEQYKFMTNDMNISALHGDLLLEPVCQNPVLDEDATDACSGFVGDVKIPKVGSRVRVKGSHVLDSTHGWNEIHPVTSIVVE